MKVLALAAMFLAVGARLVLAQNAVQSSKLIAGGVLQGAAINTSKLVAYAVLQSAPIPKSTIVLRAPLTHW